MAIFVQGILVVLTLSFAISAADSLKRLRLLNQLRLDYLELLPSLWRTISARRHYVVLNNRGDCRLEYDITLERTEESPVVYSFPIFTDLTSALSKNAIRIEEIRVGTRSVPDPQACLATSILHKDEVPYQERGMVRIPLNESDFISKLGKKKGGVLKLYIRVVQLGAFGNMFEGDYVAFTATGPTDLASIELSMPFNLNLEIVRSEHFPRGLQVREISTEVTAHGEVEGAPEPTVYGNTLFLEVHRPRINYEYVVRFKASLS